jgi:transcriptional regulator with XRE-family HTH domain
MTVLSNQYDRTCEGNNFGHWSRLKFRFFHFSKSYLLLNGLYLLRIAYNMTNICIDNFAHELREVIGEMTHSQVADVTGFSRTAIAGWLSGRRIPHEEIQKMVLEKLRSYNAPPSKVSLREKGPACNAIPDRYRISSANGDNLDMRTWDPIIQLKKSWKAYPKERSRIQLSIETVFPDDSENILKWFGEK